MIHLITGSPGTGKTLWTVDEPILGELTKQAKKKSQGIHTFDYLVGEEVIDEEMSLNNDSKNVTKKLVYRSLDVERPIYTNINGLNIQNVHKIPEDNYDFRQFPEGSIVIYDECQQLPSFKSSRSQPDEIVEALQVHRHKGYDIYFITQSPSFVNKYVKDVVGRHIHFRSLVAGVQSVGYQWSECQDNPSSETAKRIVERKINFFYPKRLFGLYKSTVLDTHRNSLWETIKLHKFKIAPFLLGGLGILWSVYNFLYGGFFFPTEDKDKKAPSTAVEGSTVNKVSQVPSVVASVPAQSEQVQQVYNLNQNNEVQYEANRVAMYWEMDGVSVCFNTFGQRLNMPEPQCKLYSNPTMFSPSYNDLKARIQQTSVNKSSNEPEDKTKTTGNNAQPQKETKS